MKRSKLSKDGYIEKLFGVPTDINKNIHKIIFVNLSVCILSSNIPNEVGKTGYIISESISHLKIRKHDDSIIFLRKKGLIAKLYFKENSFIINFSKIANLRRRFLGLSKKSSYFVGV